MQRKYLLLLTGINCILVLGLVAWVLHLQTRRPVTQLPTKNVERKVAPFKTLRANVESATNPVEKRRAVLALPPTPKSIAVLEAVLAETPDPENPGAWVQLQNTALEKFAASASHKDVFVIAKDISLDASRPIPVRDHALRIAIHKAGQVVESGQTVEGEGSGSELDARTLIEKALNSTDNSLHGTTVLGLSFLYNKNNAHISIEEVRGPVTSTLENESATEHSVLCALQVVSECRLQDLEPLVWKRLQTPGTSEAVLLRAIAALGIIGNEASARRLTALEPRTPEQFHALTNSVARIRQRDAAEAN